MVSIDRERKNRAKLLPDGLSRGDRFWYRVIYLLADLQEYILTRFVREAIWRSQDGKVRRICQLKDRHLCNIARAMARGSLDPKPEIFAEMKARELYING